MTAKYSQMVEQRGIRATVTIEITTDAYQEFDEQAVKAAANELKRGDRDVTVDTSQSFFSSKRTATFPSLIEKIRGFAEIANEDTRTAILDIAEFVAIEANAAANARRTDERAQDDKITALGQTAADLAAQNVRLADEKAALEKQLASAIEIRDQHAGANAHLARELTEAKEKLRKRTASKKAKKPSTPQKKRG
ncbi:MAG: hypothetical protein ACRDAM_16010 [Casimicrobium sp.]